MAIHAVADSRNPLTRGFVVLSQKNLFAGELRTKTFTGWSKRQPLVVMSACQTALGRVFEGGTIGVARTWTNAGAGQVVASLWNVSDLATYRLMTRFVAGLKQGKVPELAMQAALLETIKNYPNGPKMWASFTIIGKPSIDSRAKMKSQVGGAAYGGSTTMEFNLLSWWQRKRIQATVQLSGRPMQFHHVTNPYHAVSVKAGAGCEQTAQKHGRQRFLSSEAPPLPQPTCDARACECRYVHHEDRREGFDRRQRDVWALDSQLATGSGRRASHGRRVTDH